MKSQSMSQNIEAVITRHDAAIAPMSAVEQQALSASSIVRATVQHHLAHAAPDLESLARMSALAHAFLDSLHQPCAGAPDRSLDEQVLTALAPKTATDDRRTTAAVTAFLDGAQDHASWHLRKNAVMATFMILRQADLWGGLEPARGLRTPKRIVRDEQDLLPDGGKPGQKIRTRVATTDEVILVRLAARLDCTSDSLHRRAAAVAVATTGALVAEGAMVRWQDITPTRDNDDDTDDTDAVGRTGSIDLAGRHLHDPSSAWYSAARTLTLDAWSTQAVADWREEAGSTGREIFPAASMLYDGRHALDSQRAKICFDKHVYAVLQVADLAWLPAMTTGALGEWASAHALVHHPDSLDQAAHVMGVDPFNCQRRLTKASQRGYRVPTTR